MDCAILAGGKSTRMGMNKALLKLGPHTLLEHQMRILSGIFGRILVSVDRADEYGKLQATFVTDIAPPGTPHQLKGALIGIYSSLRVCRSRHLFVVACDMPLIRADVVDFLARLTPDYDVVIPLTERGLEPLHAFYSKACLKPIEELLLQGRMKIIEFFDKVTVRTVAEDEAASIDPYWSTLANINSPEDYEHVKRMLRL